MTRLAPTSHGSLTVGRGTPNLAPPTNIGSLEALSPARMAEDNRIHVMDEADVHRAIARMAREIVERNGGTTALTLLGIHRRGTDVASLLRDEIERASGDRVAYGSIDITLYRDDLMTIGPRPVVGASELPQSGIDDRNIVIVDDVLYRGRTARAALDELTDWVGPDESTSAFWWTGGGGSCPSSRISWVGKSRRWITSVSTCSCRRWMGVSE